jgi:tRNA A-37 threonylcarbamoyl transferase component Bud32
MKTMVSTAASGLLGSMEIPDVLPAGAKAGPWVVERELGRGGMGAVYAVVHEEIGKRAALKVVHQRLLVPGFNCERMLLEARVVNQVGHPNIVDIFETGKLADGRPYIVMERLDGQALSARANDGKLLPDLVIAILLQVCDALVAAHTAGVVHRDLKLDNVFLVDNPEDPVTPKAKLLDWGIAKVLSHDVKHTIEGQLVGTPQYLAPEQARGQAVSPQTDVYSLGVMAYELFLEQLPFEAETAAEVMAMHLRSTPPPPSDMWPDVPQQLEDLLLAMLAKQPDQRPTILEVARRLEAVRAELERRRHAHAYAGHSAATGTPSGVSKQLRAVSSAGHAHTELAGWRTATKRWQFALGALALAASGMLFWISRVGDRAASAATSTATTMNDSAAADVDHIHRARHGLTAPTEAAGALDFTFDPGRRPSPAAEPATESAVGPAAGATTAPAQGSLRSIAAAAHVDLVSITPPPPPAARSTPPRATAPRPAPAHGSPAAPRRGTRFDPDGTFDPYR